MKDKDEFKQHERGSSYAFDTRFDSKKQCLRSLGLLDIVSDEMPEKNVRINTAKCHTLPASQSLLSNSFLKLSTKRHVILIHRLPVDGEPIVLAAHDRAARRGELVVDPAHWDGLPNGHTRTTTLDPPPEPNPTDTAPVELDPLADLLAHRPTVGTPVARRPLAAYDTAAGLTPAASAPTASAPTAPAPTAPAPTAPAPTAPVPTGGPR